MRRNVFLLIMVAIFCYSTVYSQIDVFGNGNMAVKGTLTSSNTGLSVGDKSYNNSYSVYASCVNPATECYNIGAEGYSLLNSAIIGRSCGVRGVAGNCTSGWNYGVLGVLQGSTNGAGVFGSVSSPLGISTKGKYAGYFHGDIKVTGVAKGCWANHNDTEVVGYGSIQSAMDIINSFHTKMGTATTFVFSAEAPQNEDTGEEARTSETHYAFIPSYTQIAYPALVCQAANGSKYVNYTEVIPILVEAIKQLYSQVTSLAMDENEMNGFADSTTYAHSLATPFSECHLSDIAPNPFSSAAVVKYSLPHEICDAWLSISDMQSTPLIQLPLDISADRVTIRSDNLQPGMYLCTLVVNGKNVESKRVIFVK